MLVRVNRAVGAKVGVRLLILSIFVVVDGRLAANLWFVVSETAVQVLRCGNECSLSLSLSNSWLREGEWLYEAWLCEAWLSERLEWLNLTTHAIQDFLKKNSPLDHQLEANAKRLTALIG